MRFLLCFHSQQGGAEVDDFEGFESQAAIEFKQQSLDVDLTVNSLSRTPSVRSNTGTIIEPKITYVFDRLVGMFQINFELVLSSKTEAHELGHQTSMGYRPESSSSAEQLDSPDREMLQLGGSMECASPAPTSATAYASSAAAVATGAATMAWDYDPSQAWDDGSGGVVEGNEGLAEAELNDGSNGEIAQQAYDTTIQPVDG